MDFHDFEVSRLTTREFPHQTKSDLVCTYLRESIITGRFKPGERIGQQELAETLNLSPTPVREALQKLSAQGVLSHIPHHGVQVNLPTSQVVDEVYSIRVHLEGMAVEEATDHLDKDLLSWLQQVAVQIMPELFNDCTVTRDFTPFRIVNYRFHRALYTASKMLVIPDLIDNLWARAMVPDSFFTAEPTRAQESANEHGIVVEALEAGDGKLARQIIEEHVDANRRAFLRCLSEHESRARPSLTETGSVSA